MTLSMANVLALDTYHAGSHKAVIQAWMQRSQHNFQLRTLPGRHWKWRMRHAALSFVELCQDLKEEPDCIWCTDMLDLAAWRGLAPRHLADKPHILYMHENQLLYPDAHKQQRDDHYAFTNFTSCCAADLIAWNSAWHRDQFITDMTAHLKKMPDFQLDVEQLHKKSVVLYPGFHYQECPYPAEKHRPCLLWAARWEWEKGPEILFDALAQLDDDYAFDLMVLGGDPKRQSDLFKRAEQTWQHRIIQWGYVDSGDDYWRALHQADAVISSARHEFFGLAMVEGCAAGAHAILPRRLSYPEVFAHVPETTFYAGDSDSLARVLRGFIETWSADPAARAQRQAAMKRYTWDELLPAWDTAVDDLLLG